MNRKSAPTTRRANGEGSITSRSDGALLARVTDPTTTKRVKRVVVRAPGETPAQHRRRAEAVLAGFRGEMARPATERESWTVARWVTERYLSSVERRARSTVENYEAILRLYVLPSVGAIELSTLTVDDVEALDDRLLAEGLAVSTRRAARAALGRVLRHARKRKLATDVTVDANEIDDDDRDRTKGTLEPDQVRALLAAARGTRWEASVALLALTGMRRGEVLGLAWDAVDLDAGTLNVRRNLVALNRGVALGSPKTRASRRTLTLPASAVASLRQHRAHQAEHRLAAGELWQSDMTDADGPVALVFVDEIGRAIQPHQLATAVARLARTAGIERNVHPHLLRHSTASLLLAEGHDLAAVSAVLGHSSTAVTASVYTHAVARTKHAATQAMADAVGAW